MSVWACGGWGGGFAERRRRRRRSRILRRRARAACCRTAEHAARTISGSWAASINPFMASGSRAAALRPDMPVWMSVLARSISSSFALALPLPLPKSASALGTDAIAATVHRSTTGLESLMVVVVGRRGLKEWAGGCR